LVSFYKCIIKINNSAKEQPEGSTNPKEVEIIDRAKLRMERNMERKLISQAAKNFNIHLHTKNLRKENQEYLDKLSNQVCSKLDLYINPIKRATFKIKKKHKNDLDTSDSFSSSLSNHSNVSTSALFLNTNKMI
jgi:hypothetical protein